MRESDGEDGGGGGGGVFKIQPLQWQMWNMQITRYMSHNETFSHEPTWRNLGTLKPAPSRGRDAAKWLKLWLHWATCASREVCRPDVWNGFYSYSSPLFLVHHTSRFWLEAVFHLSRARKKYLSSPAGSVSYMTTKISLRLSTCKCRSACARASWAIKTGDNFVYWVWSKWSKY